MELLAIRSGELCAKHQLLFEGILPEILYKALVVANVRCGIPLLDDPDLHFRRFDFVLQFISLSSQENNCLSAIPTHYLIAEHFGPLEKGSLGPPGSSPFALFVGLNQSQLPGLHRCATPAFVEHFGAYPQGLNVEPPKFLGGFMKVRTNQHQVSVHVIDGPERADRFEHG